MQVVYLNHVVNGRFKSSFICSFVHSFMPNLPSGPFISSETMFTIC